MVKREKQSAEASNGKNKPKKHYHPSKLPLSQISVVRPYGRGGAFISVPLVWIDHRVHVELVETEGEDMPLSVTRDVKASGAKRANVYLPTAWIGKDVLVTLIEFSLEEE